MSEKKNSATKRLKTILITGTTLAQGRNKERGKLTLGYQEACSICEFDIEDLKTLGVSSNQNVRVTSNFGSVVVKAVEAKESQRGLVFIPGGPWANILIGPGTDGTGMPQFKGIEVEAEPSSEKVMNLEELIKTVYGG